jgi:hypothetical protein
MTRRELLRLGGSSLLYASLLRSRAFSATGGSATSPYLFVNPAELELIRGNATTALLRPMYEEWAAKTPADLAATITKFEETGDLIYDFAKILTALEHSLTVQLINPSPERAASCLATVEFLIDLPDWDYFLDGGTEVLGIQRASYATVRMLYAREVLGELISPELDQHILEAIADKGCQACYAAVNDMDHPETVIDWDFHPDHGWIYDIDTTRWPDFFGANNLRAAPTGALGLGALALLGQDDRAQLWLDTAVASTQRFLKLFSPDGSFFEGLSYLDYSMRTTMPFMDAHQRLDGSVDWLREFNFAGTVEYSLGMTLGRNADGTPDIVNFSDARSSFAPGWMSRLGQTGNDALAHHAADYAGNPRWFYDFLWYRPEAPREAPPAALLNYRNDYNWIICRSGWEPTAGMLAFKSGGPANHEHADRNHITYKFNGERLLQDHFGAAYDRRKDGWKMRHTAGHNAILIDGRGHHYVDGTEGTNQSLAYANILDYQDLGEMVHWTSDATPGYIVEDYHVTQVQRSVIYAKPGTIVVFDQVNFRYKPQTVTARFFPDNHDGAAELSVDGADFTLTRPQARLQGLVVSNCDAAPRLGKLDVKPETGDFPCVEVHSPRGLSHQIVTVLHASSNGAAAGPCRAKQDEAGHWLIDAPGLQARIEPTAYAPRISLS